MIIYLESIDKGIDELISRLTDIKANLGHRAIATNMFVCGEIVEKLFVEVSKETV